MLRRMQPSEYVTFDPLLGAEGADAMMRLAERWGTYKTYAEEPVFEGLGEGLPARFDAAFNFVRTGGRFGRKDEDVGALAARTNYFRETYAYDGKPAIDGIEPFLFHEGLIEAARKIFDRPVVKPAIAFANFLVPGQELAIHTDVPEFRGVNRTRNPQWLLVAMHHSGLFEDWRMPIATGVSWFGRPRGGEFAFYPRGADAAPEAIPAKHDTGICIDTDSVFHGVDRVAKPDTPPPEARPGSTLTHEGGGRWVLRSEGHPPTIFGWDDLRFSVSWKAYCFESEDEARAWESHSDDIHQDEILRRLVEDLRERGRIEGETPEDRELAFTIVDEYVRFPAPRPEEA
jgi:hypothetical protein